MVAVSLTTARKSLKSYCDIAVDDQETVYITREGGRDVVMISSERFAELERAERNAAYMRKLEQGYDHVRAGRGIVRTIEELEAMEDDGL